MSYHWQHFSKWFREWLNGRPAGKPKQHIFREPGKVEEDPVSYEPGFWDKTAKPFAKTAMYFAIVGGIAVAAGGFWSASCAYQDKAEALAEQRRVDTEKTEPCKSSIITRKGQDSLDTKCKHHEHVLRTKWERGELTIQCLCPNTVADEKDEPEEGNTSEEEVEPEEEESEPSDVEPLIIPETKPESIEL